MATKISRENIPFPVLLASLVLMLILIIAVATALAMPREDATVKFTPQVPSGTSPTVEVAE